MSRQKPWVDCWSHEWKPWWPWFKDPADPTKTEIEGKENYKRLHRCRVCGGLAHLYCQDET